VSSPRANLTGCSRTRPRSLASVAIGSALLLTSGVAAAASIQGPIHGWEQGTEPSWVQMYIYVPDSVATNAAKGVKPPILVTVHYCAGDARGIFSEATSGGMVAAADANGFIMLLPQTNQSCWDVASEASLKNVKDGGGGDTKAIVDQVNYTIATYGANKDRVYVTGSSSGGMVTEALAAIYPDVFKAGAEFAGVPAGCWAVSDPNGDWSSPCAGGMVTHTPQEWGDIARAMDLNYTGYRPRLQLWHGDADSVILYTNHTEAIKQWTNVLNLTAPPVTSTVNIGGHDYTREEYKDGCGTTMLDAWTEPGGPHSTDANMNAQYSMPFLGLDMPGPTDPHATVCTMSAGATAAGGPTLPATGCVCRMGKPSGSNGALAFALAGLTAATFSRRRSKRQARVS
jgi:acetylxylan esterase